MRVIIFLILLIFLPAVSSHAETLPPKQKGFLLAQGGADVKIPVIQEPSLPPPPDAEEEKKNKGDAVVLPPLPVPPAASTPSVEKETSVVKDTEPSPSSLPATSPLPSDTKEENVETPQQKTPEAVSGAKPKMSREEYLKKLDQCKSLPAKLQDCEAFRCEFSGFEENAPDFVKAWDVVRKEDGVCLYNELMLGNATMQCRLSDASRKTFSNFFDVMFVQKKVVDDKELNSAYLKVQQTECHMVGEDGNVIKPELYKVISRLPQHVEDYGASDAPKGDCETLDEKLKTCEPFYCNGNDPIQEKFFSRKIAVERKIIGWLGNECIYVQKTAGKNLVGCKYAKADGTGASQCSMDVMVEISDAGTMFNKLTLAEKAAMNDPTLKAPKNVEEEIKKNKEESSLMNLADRNYNTQMLPPLIYRKQYDEQNKNLPVPYYPGEYKAMAFAALDRNDLETVKTLVDKIKEIDDDLNKQKKPLLGGIEIQDENGNTLLIRSVMGGNFAAVRMLVGEGADINAHNHSGVTALQAAAYGGREDIVTLLLGMGAKRDLADNYGRTALTHSIEKHYTGITRLLLNRNANPNATGGAVLPPLVVATKLGDVSAVASLLDSKVTIDARDGEGMTALMRAAESGNVEIVNLLVKHGANVFLQDRAGRTAEVLAATAGHANVARLLASFAISKRLGK